MPDLITTEPATPEAPQPTPGAEPVVTTIRRDASDTPPEDKANVGLLTKRVKEGKTFHEKAFKRMREDMKFLKGKQWSDSPTDDRYVANITLRQLTQHVAALYAKNPRFVARRRPTLDFAVWDETAASLMNLQSEMTQAQLTGQMSPTATALLEDLKAGQFRKQMIDRVGKTLQLVMKQQIDVQIPPFKKQMKQLVRRTVTTAVGYLKLGFQRAFQPRPEDVEKINDCRERVLEIQRILGDMQDEQASAESQAMLAEKAQLEQMILAMQSDQDRMIVNEGLVFDFPRATAIIVDPCCTQLDGFIGAKWVAQEYLLTVDEVKRIYEVDVGNNFTPYMEGDQGVMPMPKPAEEVRSQGRMCVWEVYDKVQQVCYVVADGYPDYLKAPGAPACKLRRFWPFFALTFNEVEDDTEHGLYPQSDVSLMRPMQMEYNRSRERLREHRNANTPKYASPRGALEEKDKQALQGDVPGTIVELNNLNVGQKVLDILQPVVHPAVDPALYDTAHIFDDIQRTSGAAEANLGGTSGATATESSIAEASRSSGIASNQDDLDDFLSEVAQESGQLLLCEFDRATAVKIAGPGAAWPDAAQSREEILQQIYLEIEAGSSGKPNKAQEIANFERLAPIMIQIPGISAEWFAKKAVEILDDKLDVSEALLAGAQAIVAQNRMGQLATGSPATDPNQQGPQGANNAPAMPPGPSPMQSDTMPTNQPKLYGIAKGERAAA